jgi:hypothetical protein
MGYFVSVDAGTAAKTGGFTIFPQEVRSSVVLNQPALWFQVPDVDTTFRDWSARGVQFAHSPRKAYSGLRRSRDRSHGEVT